MFEYVVMFRIEKLYDFIFFDGRRLYLKFESINFLGIRFKELI